VPTTAELRRWPVTVSLVEAGRCWSLGRDTSYRMAAAGTFPVPVLRLGRRMVVTRAAILNALGIADPDNSHAPAPSGQVGGVAAVFRSDAREGT
jgi:predicted DNA-binding transcriptional regulator AlpA